MALFLKQLTQCFRRPKPRRVAPPRRRSTFRASRPVRGYVLVVDESGSTGSPFRMAAGRSTSRIAAIQQAAQTYVRQLGATNPHQLVGLVGFSQSATLYHPLAPVGAAGHSLCRAVRGLHPQSTTNLSGGLALALDLLAKAHVSMGNVVVITDGAANEQRGHLPGLVRRAKARRVRIFTIGVGNNVDADYDRSLLLAMARATGGRFSSAHSFEELTRALRRAG